MQNDNLNFKNNFNKRLIQFALDIIELCEIIRKKFRALWVIADQLTDSGTSIGANIREARASSSRKDYIKFFEIALKSANETGFWLEIIIYKCQDEKDKAERILKEDNEIASIIASGLLTMKGRK